MLSQKTLSLARGLGPVVVDIESTGLTERDIRRIRHPLAGMVILFSRNYRSPGQLTALCGAIHALRPGMVIAVDHEGGRVQRFREGFTEVPAMGALREKGPGIYWSAGFVIGSELRACGVDLTFAPVLDIDHGRSEVIGNRSMGEDASEVTINGAMFIGGLAAAGMGAVGKHFPGHGWASADSHVALPVDDRPVDALFADFQPFIHLAPLLSGVMTAHVRYSAFSDEIATFSKSLIGMLRDEELMTFSGLVFSDDLSMKAAENDESTPLGRARRALDAGCDMILHCNHPEELDEILEGLEWRRPAAFSERLARLIPAQGAVERKTLSELEVMRRSRAVLLEA